MKFFFWLNIFSLIVISPLLGQSIDPSPTLISLNNPSFEDRPRISSPPEHWYYCGPMDESPPDIHPNNLFGVSQSPYHGITYVGMVVRDNDSWEAIGQRLSSPLQAGHCYQFGLFACRSEFYNSISRMTSEAANYNEPIQIRILGGQKNCEGLELLSESQIVSTTEWTYLEFSLQPSQRTNTLIIEAYFNPEKSEPYNGNVLIDQATPIIPISCEDQIPLLPVEDSEFTAPGSLVHLEELIIGNGPLIQFIGISKLEQHLFTSADGGYCSRNKYLWEIAQAVRYFPNQKLVIGLQTPHKSHYKKQVEALSTLLQQAKLTEKQFQIKRYKAKGRWLWPLEKGQTLTMYLE